MTDASARAELETLQAENRRLRDAIAAFPSISMERTEVSAAVELVEREHLSVRALLTDARAREVKARDQLDLRGGDKRPWWKAPALPVIMGVAFIGSWFLGAW